MALTRARAKTHIYATDGMDVEPGHDRLDDLAERLDRSEPEVPSIDTPLAHEAAITAAMDTERLGGHTAELTLERAGDTRPDTRPGIETAAPHEAERGDSLDQAPGRIARRWPRIGERDAPALTSRKNQRWTAQRALRCRCCAEMRECRRHFQGDEFGSRPGS